MKRKEKEYKYAIFVKKRERQSLQAPYLSLLSSLSVELLRKRLPFCRTEPTSLSGTTSLGVVRNLLIRRLFTA